MNISHKIRLYPNKSQEIAFKKACGCARFSYNWALAEWKKQYDIGIRPGAFSLRKAFNKIKRQKFPWIYESAKDVNQRPFIQLEIAYKNFFDKKAKYPKFKKKGDKDSFYVSNSVFWTDNDKVKLPLIGLVKMAEPLRFNGKIMSGTVSRQADKWYISIQVELDKPPKAVKPSKSTIGIDLGLKTTISDSNGNSYNSPRPLKKYGKKLARLQRRHSKKQKGSKNREKSRIKIAKLHAKITDIRNDWNHKITSKLIDENQVICLENLNVSGMLKNHKLAKAISDVSWSEIRRQLEYKAKMHSRELKFVDRFFPSSKMCSGCGCAKEKLKLSERTYDCEVCGLSMDRDLNAAINIKNTANHAEIKACGLATPVRNQEETRILGPSGKCNV